MNSYFDKNKCLVSSKENINKWYSHKDVCKDLPIEYDGYCILHYPNDNKCENTNFEEIINEKINNGDYKFDFVYFPKVIFWENKIFENDVSFNSAIFKQGVYFRFSEFQKDVDFNCSIFNGVNFQFSKFHQYTSFRFAKFNDKHEPLLPEGYELNATDFRNTIFDGNTDFTNAEFYSTTNFSQVEINKELYFLHSKFFNNCYFNKIKLKEDALIIFGKAIFSKVISFNYSYLNGYISFDGDNDNPLFDGVNTRLSLQFAKIKNPQNIEFNSIRLFPNWFINSDSRKFVFVNVAWENSNLINLKKNINTELQNIEKLNNIPNARHLLKITLRRLAANYLENEEFEQSSIFRRMAFETEWLEKTEKIKNWFNNLLPESEKLKRRFSGSTNEEDKPIPPTNSFGILRRSGDFIIHALYRITSFYGESWSWAFTFLLLLILLIFPIGYSISEFQVTPNNIPLGVVVNGCKDVVEELKPICKIENRNLYFFSEAIPHSLATATLQNVEYRVPKTTAGYIWTILEKIFAPLRAALLALAIRRKFMR